MPESPTSLEITRPDDWHLHLRDGDLLERVVPATARRFGRAIVMPNLVPAVTTVERALAYRDRILAACPADASFEPLMTLYLTDETPVSEVEAAAKSPHIAGVKVYPRGATTHSSEGVSDLVALGTVLEAMAASGLPLLVHGETTAPETDVFDRERVYLEETLSTVIDRYPALRVVFEHITTREAAKFVRAAPARVAATITPQHLLLNRNALFAGGLRPHHYCLPVLKREHDRQALLAAATSGDPSFFLGTDSAPHLRHAKESDCGCAGIYSAPIALEAYAEAFASAGALDRLEGFASHFGADFYGLPRNPGRVRLVAEPWSPPEWDGEGAAALRIFLGGETLRYRVA
ncbi:MAG: dihydroorotase [Myxococcota bacterium]